MIAESLDALLTSNIASMVVTVVGVIAAVIGTMEVIKRS